MLEDHDEQKEERKSSGYTSLLMRQRKEKIYKNRMIKYA